MITHAMLCCSVAMDRKMPLILPHELCHYMYHRGSKHYGSDCEAELRKFWQHFKKCTNDVAIKWPHMWEDTCTPIGLHGDDCRVTETGQKVICLSVNYLLDETQRRYPLFIIRYEP